MKARLVAYKDGKLLTSYSLPEPGTTIGRGEDNHVVLDHPMISRNHAAIHAKDDMWVIKDLSSTNGIEVNGVPVNNAVLKSGDTIGIDPFYLVFETTLDDSPWAPERRRPIPTARRPVIFEDLAGSGPQTLPNKPK